MPSLPPFKLASPLTVDPVRGRLPLPHPGCCEGAEPSDELPAQGRKRLADLDPHIHCSVLGTCLGTADLRKVMARFIDVEGATDLAVHHDAVALATEARVAKALQKALDKRHEAVVQRFSKTRDPRELEALWEDALHAGEIPGAYWAVLTHRHVTADLSQRVFGEVHMLSHLVGAANRADIRRLVALERENADLHDRLERQHLRTRQLVEERDAASASDQHRALAMAAARPEPVEAACRPEVDVDAIGQMVALQTDRCERAEAALVVARADAERLQHELDHLREHACALGRELAAAEIQLHDPIDGGTGEAPRNSLTPRLKGRRILYVGGRPSSTPAIRDLVKRHGGEFQKHDGGLEDRKGLLASGVSWAEFVLFPVDCIDHDSATRLKRVCAKVGTPFVPLRSASVASFAAAVATLDDTRSAGADARRPPLCSRHA